MRVVHVASEAVPFAKTGGLGDVLGALPAALRRGGSDVMLCLPGHRSALRAAGATDVVDEVWAPVSSRTEPVRVLAVRDAAVPTLLFDAPQYFDRPELYGTGGADYPDNAERFVVFCRAVLDWLRRSHEPPDVVHVHDWQAALVPAFLRATPDLYPELARARTVTTIHNLAFQGRFWAADWHLLNLDRRWFRPDALEFYGDLSFLKAGLVFADVITTVSPRYAREIQTPALGAGLDGLLRARAGALVGILNGVDYREWNPATDPAIPARYDRTDLAGKRRCKLALQAELHVTVDAGVPLLAIVSRLTLQKGIDLLVAVAGELLDTTPIELVVLGSGEARFEAALRGLAERFPGRAAVRIGFDDPLAHRLEAGADVFLMPSRFEPCGLSQLYSLRYGTVPVVHATGGLDDTIEAYDPATGAGTGFKFDRFEPGAFADAIRHALATWCRQDRWAALVDAGMRADFSWDRAAASYRALYERVVAG